MIKLSSSVNAGFILALPFHHGDLEPDCVGVSTGGLAYVRDKNTSARLCTKNAGRAYVRGECICGTLRHLLGSQNVYSGTNTE